MQLSVCWEKKLCSLRKQYLKSAMAATASSKTSFMSWFTCTISNYFLAWMQACSRLNSIREKKRRPSIKDSSMYSTISSEKSLTLLVRSSMGRLRQKLQKRYGKAKLDQKRVDTKQQPWLTLKKTITQEASREYSTWQTITVPDTVSSSTSGRSITQPTRLLSSPWQKPVLESFMSLSKDVLADRWAKMRLLLCWLMYRSSRQQASSESKMVSRAVSRKKELPEQALGMTQAVATTSTHRNSMKRTQSSTPIRQLLSLPDRKDSSSALPSLSTAGPLLPQVEYCQSSSFSEKLETRTLTWKSERRTACYCLFWGAKVPQAILLCLERYFLESSRRMSMALLDWAESETLDFDLSPFLLSSRFACLYKVRPLYYSLSFIDIYIVRPRQRPQRKQGTLPK